ncbi:MAG: hypothetical protein CME65_08050 [Halobacteriovoraceae bacterium]|nr:hypothetical protein [Halobacteriovoraceae bacterium]
MKNVLNQIFKLANFAIIFQLVTMPLASAFDNRNGGGFGEQNSQGFSDYSGYTNAAFQVSSFFNQAANAFLGVQQGPVDRTQQYIQQLTPMLAMTPQPPGTYPAAFNGCTVLSSTPNTLGAGSTCDEVPPQQILEGYGAALMKIADDNLNAMSVASTASNDRTDFRGETCYQEGIASLAAQLKTRETELKDYVRKMEEIFQNFELASQETLEGIKQVDAILNGPCETCREKNGVAQKDYLEDFRFENILFDANDNGACGSWYSETAVREQGGRIGLKGIEREITSRQIETADRFKGQRQQIRNEIMSLTSSIASTYKNRNQFTANGLNAANRTTLFSSTSPALASAIQRFDTRINNQIGDLNRSLDMENLIGSQQGSEELQLLYRQIQAGTGDLDNVATQITMFERQTKAQCFRGLVTSALENDNIQEGLKGFNNPNVSGNKRRNADSSLATSLANQISNLDNMTFDEFIAEVERIEMTGTNALKTWLPGRGIDFGNGDQLGASDRLRPSGLFQRLANNCDQQFRQKRSDLGGVSLNKMVSNLRDYAVQMNRLKETANGNLLADLRRDLLTCPDDSSTGSADMSCNADRMSPTGGAFCLASAQRCMANVYSCQDKITAKIQEAETQQKTLMTNYKAEVDTAKQQLLAEVTQLEQFMIQSARQLDAQLNLGTVTETPGLQIDLTGTNFLRDDMRADLRLEDPEKYLAEIKKQITGEGGNPQESLLGQLEKQREELVGQIGDDPTGDLRGKGRLGAMAAQYVQSYQDNADYFREIIRSCSQAMTRANQQEQERLDGIAEQNQQIADACSAVQAFNSNPLEGDLAEIAGDAASAVRIAASMPNPGRFVNQYQDMREIERIRNFNQSCADSDGGGFGNRNIRATAICSVAQNNRTEPSLERDKEIWELTSMSSQRDTILDLCGEAGIIEPRRNVAGENGVYYCSENQADRPFGDNAKICYLTEGQPDFAVYVRIDGDTRTTIDRPPSYAVADGGITCADINDFRGFAEEEDPNNDPGADIRFRERDVSRERIDRSIVQAAVASSRYDGEYCIPGSGNTLDFQSDRREYAREELEYLAAGFNCARAERSTGQVRLSICSADVDGFLTSKGIDPRLGSEAAQALGQALAQ